MDDLLHRDGLVDRLVADGVAALEQARDAGVDEVHWKAGSATAGDQRLSRWASEEDQPSCSLGRRYNEHLAKEPPFHSSTTQILVIFVCGHSNPVCRLLIEELRVRVEFGV